MGGHRGWRLARTQWPGDRAMTQSNTGSYGNDQPAEGEKLAQPIHYVAPKKFTKFLSL